MGCLSAQSALTLAAGAIVQRVRGLRNGKGILSPPTLFCFLNDGDSPAVQAELLEPLAGHCQRTAAVGQVARVGPDGACLEVRYRRS
ncbi:MAG: hypothetical protein ACE5ER_11960 [Nitrospinaceae bacterium]